MLCVTAAAPATSSSLLLFGRKSRNSFSRRLCTSLSSESTFTPPQQEKQSFRANHAGVRLEETVQDGTGRTRLDAWISSHMGDVSRARIQATIRSGLVSVNGRTVNKVFCSIFTLALFWIRTNILFFMGPV